MVIKASSGSSRKPTSKASPKLDSRQRKILKLKHEMASIDVAIAENEALVQRYKQEHKIEYFTPFEHQQRVISFIISGKKTVLLQGANQIGKTIAGANLSGAFSLFCVCPWDKKEIYPSLFAKMNQGSGIIGRIVCNDWEKAARDTIVPKLKEWLPVGSYETKKNNVGVEHEFIFPKTGSKFTILTYKEDTKSHEGWTGDWVWFDEPPPKDKYTANRRGLIAREGLVFISMTALDEPWILDDIVLKPDPSCGIVADIPIRANPTLSEESIRIFEKDLPESEKVARIQGGWMQLMGRIWKGFDVNIHTCNPFPIPPDWPCEFQIDFHLNLPHAIIFYACDKFGRKFYFGEVWENMGSEEIADAIIKRKIKDSLRLTYGEIDALSKGDTAYTKNRFGTSEDSFTIIQRKLNRYGIRLGVGSKDEKSYIRAVETAIKGPNGEPLIKIFNDCPEAIKQVQRWAYDDNEKPNSDGHFPECIGRSMLTGLRYTSPQQWSQALKYAEMPI